MEQILSFVGVLFVGKFVLDTICNLLVGVKVHFLSRVFKKDLVKSYGKWAVVTGCTDGIGKAYMNELAKRGMDIVLISRNMSKLEKCAKEVREAHGVKTEIIQVDFSEGKPIYKNIEKGLDGKEIGILVNNVGVMLDRPKVLTQARDDEIWSHINVNVATVPVLMNMILPQMVTRGKGVIVNVASIAASGPIPYMGIYSASKSFVDYVSAATCSEYEGSGVTIQTLSPSYVATNMTSFSDVIGKASILVPTADVYAQNAVNTLGYTTETTGFWPFGIQMWAVKTFATRSLFMFSMKMFNKLVSKQKLHYE